MNLEKKLQDAIKANLPEEVGATLRKELERIEGLKQKIVGCENDNRNLRENLEIQKNLAEKRQEIIEDLHSRLDWFYECNSCGEIFVEAYGIEPPQESECSYCGSDGVLCK